MAKICRLAQACIKTSCLNPIMNGPLLKKTSQHLRRYLPRFIQNAIAASKSREQCCLQHLRGAVWSFNRKTLSVFSSWLWQRTHSHCIRLKNVIAQVVVNSSCHQKNEPSNLPVAKDFRYLYVYIYIYHHVMIMYIIYTICMVYIHTGIHT